MIFLGGLLSGGLLYSGVRARRQQMRDRVSHLKRKANRERGAGTELLDSSENLGDENYPIATATLGLTVLGRFVYAPLTIFGITGMLYLLWPTFVLAYSDLTRRKRFTSIVLEALILPGTLLAGHFLAVAVAFWFVFFAMDNAAKAKGRANANLANVFETPSSQVVYVLREGVEIESTVKDLQVGDVAIIGAGQIIPVDGTIVEGNATIDQHMLTGESQPVEKQADDAVLAATLLLDGNIRVRVERAGKETLANQSAQILNDMTHYTDNLELRGTAASDRIALPLFAAGAMTGILLGPGRGLAITWSPLDDALFVAGPLSVLNFLNIALRHDILIKDGRALEVLSNVDTIVFDKTGTLTTDIPRVVEIHACADLTATEILRYAAAAEQKQTHPIALAILDAASEKQIDLPPATAESYQKGFGLKVTIGDRLISVGSQRFMEQQSLATPESLGSVQNDSDELGYSLIYVAVDDAIVGAIEFHASVRGETAETIAKLHELGYQVGIISGDHEKPTCHLAHKLGIDHCFPETLPKEKGEIIKAMQDKGRTVCYVGDGINDTIALKQAEVSVSLRGASTIATDMAQIVLMKEDLNQLLDLLVITKRLDRNYKASVVFSAVPTAAIFAGVLFFQMTLATAIALYLTGIGLSITQAMTPLLEERRLERKAQRKRPRQHVKSTLDDPLE